MPNLCLIAISQGIDETKKQTNKQTKTKSKHKQQQQTKQKQTNKKPSTAIHFVPVFWILCFLVNLMLKVFITKVDCKYFLEGCYHTRIQ